MGHFWYINLWVPDPPPPLLSSNTCLLPSLEVQASQPPLLCSSRNQRCCCSITVQERSGLSEYMPSLLGPRIIVQHIWDLQPIFCEAVRLPEDCPHPFQLHAEVGGVRLHVTLSLTPIHGPYRLLPGLAGDPTAPPCGPDPGEARNGDAQGARDAAHPQEVLCGAADLLPEVYAGLGAVPCRAAKWGVWLRTVAQGRRLLQVNAVRGHSFVAVEVEGCEGQGMLASACELEPGALPTLQQVWAMRVWSARSWV